jgi:two-component system LytT family response regulator
MSEEQPKRLRIVIADDEILARQRIEDLLAKESDIDLVGMAGSGPETVEMIRALKPDLLFLDVQMPGKSGIEVVEEIGAEQMPATIFVTAFDQFALKAFDVAAVDYLLKPFDDERFFHAFRRARRAIELEEVERTTRRLLALLHDAGNSASPDAPGPAPEYLDRLPVESRGQLSAVPVTAIDYITASGPYAELHAGERTWVVRERMQSLEEKLDPALFLRVHRSTIVRRDRIETLLRSSGGDYAVRLRDGTELSVSRSRREELERHLGLSR